MYKKIKLPILIIAAVLMILSMLRLGFWQLDRAKQKQLLLDQQRSRTNQDPVSLSSLSDQMEVGESNNNALRFRPVSAVGTYLANKSIYIDNQVVDGQVGYRIFTPLVLSANQNVVLVDRGWLSAGESRAQLPGFTTVSDNIRLTGRLNTPPAQPPLWDDDYAVAQGKVWAYLPISDYALQMGLTVLPLVLELAPQITSDQQFKLNAPQINDEWVSKHQGYAFQWFAMAIAFFIACLVLLIRYLKRPTL